MLFGILRACLHGREEPQLISDMVTTTIKQDQIKLRDYIKKRGLTVLRRLPHPPAVPTSMQTGPSMAAVLLLDTYMLSHGDLCVKDL